MIKLLRIRCRRYFLRSVAPRRLVKISAAFCSSYLVQNMIHRMVNVMQSSRLAGTLVAARIMMRGCIELSSISVDLMRASISLFALNFDRKSVKLLTSMSIKVIADHDLQMSFLTLIPLLPRAIAFMVLFTF